MKNTQNSLSFYCNFCLVSPTRQTDKSIGGGGEEGDLVPSDRSRFLSPCTIPTGSTVRLGCHTSLGIHGILSQKGNLNLPNHLTDQDV